MFQHNVILNEGGYSDNDSKLSIDTRMFQPAYYMLKIASNYKRSIQPFVIMNKFFGLSFIRRPEV